MTIQYRILDNGKGVLLTRGTVSESSDATFIFDSASEKDAPSRAVFADTSGNEIYRELDGRKCSVPMRKLCGTISVAVVGVENKKRWKCDSVRFIKHGNAVIAIANEDSVYEELAALRIEYDELCAEVGKIRESVNRVSDKLENIMEGYDVI